MIYNLHMLFQAFVSMLMEALFQYDNTNVHYTINREPNMASPCQTVNIIFQGSCLFKLGRKVREPHYRHVSCLVCMSVKLLKSK